MRSLGRQGVPVLALFGRRHGERREPCGSRARRHLGRGDLGAGLRALVQCPTATHGQQCGPENGAVRGDQRQINAEGPIQWRAEALEDDLDQLDQ